MGPVSLMDDLMLSYHHEHSSLGVRSRYFGTFCITNASLPVAGTKLCKAGVVDIRSLPRRITHGWGLCKSAMYGLKYHVPLSCS